MNLYVYIHGFNTAGNGDKAIFLRENLPEDHVLSPTYPSHLPDQAIHTLSDQIGRAIRQYEPEQVILIGSSLGGFYARHLAHRVFPQAILVMINPAIDAHIIMREAIGPNKNYATGEEYVFSEENFQQLEKFAYLETHRVPTLVLLDEDDELLDSKKTFEYYEEMPRVKAICYPGGNHRFIHLNEALFEIKCLTEE